MSEEVNESEIKQEINNELNENTSENLNIDNSESDNKREILQDLETLEKKFLQLKEEVGKLQKERDQILKIELDTIHELSDLGNKHQGEISVIQLNILSIQSQKDKYEESRARLQEELDIIMKSREEIIELSDTTIKNLTDERDELKNQFESKELKYSTRKTHIDEFDRKIPNFEVKVDKSLLPVRYCYLRKFSFISGFTLSTFVLIFYKVLFPVENF